MFRCDWCENYRDKSESCENPKDDCGNICQECATEHEDLPTSDKSAPYCDPRVNPPGFAEWLKEMEAYAKEERESEEREADELYEQQKEQA